MIMGGQTTILVRTAVVSHCVIFEVRRFRMGPESSSNIQYCLLLRKLEESHGLFSVPSFVGPYCEAEWEPLRKWH